MAGCAATVSSKPSLDGISLYRSSPWLPPLTHSIISSESTYPLFVVQSDLAGRPGPFLIPLEALYGIFLLLPFVRLAYRGAGLFGLFDLGCTT
jgi:hypothetical protein